MPCITWKVSYKLHMSLQDLFLPGWDLFSSLYFPLGLSCFRAKQIHCFPIPKNSLWVPSEKVQGGQELLALHQNTEIANGNTDIINTVPFPGTSSNYPVISPIRYFFIQQYNFQGVSHRGAYSPNKIRMSPFYCGWVFWCFLMFFWVFFQMDTAFGYNFSHRGWQSHLLTLALSTYLLFSCCSPNSFSIFAVSCNCSWIWCFLQSLSLQIPDNAIGSCYKCKLKYL